LHAAKPTTGEPTVIAFFGMGLLGSNFVRALLRRGDEVHVWNRTASRARALEAEGAKAFDDPAEAAKGAARVHLALSDDTAVDDVLERARPGFGEAVAIVDHTTTSVTGTAARYERWAERRVTFQHAPVFMGPPEALRSTGVMLASGDHRQFETLAPELSKMTGKLAYLGPQPERAAAFKLMGNLFLMAMTAGIADVLTLAKALAIKPEEAATLFDVFNAGATIGARVKRILDANFSHPSWELAMARKDARLMLDEAQRGGVTLKVLPAVAREMDRWIAAGHAADDWTIIAKDALVMK
jgi:3-hydroxyisobutyrate dehydrogenase